MRVLRDAGLFFFFFLITSQSAKGNGGIHGRKKTYVAIVGTIGGHPMAYIYSCICR